MDHHPHSDASPSLGTYGSTAKHTVSLCLCGQLDRIAVWLLLNCSDSTLHWFDSSYLISAGPCRNVQSSHRERSTELKRCPGDRCRAPGSQDCTVISFAPCSCAGARLTRKYLDDLWRSGLDRRSLVGSRLTSGVEGSMSVAMQLGNRIRSVVSLE